MGRARKPLAAQKGDLTVARQVELEQAEAAVRTGADELRRPPKWLIDPVAKKEWKRVVTELSQIGIVGNLDLNNIAGYCNAFSLYRRAVTALSSDGALFDKDAVDVMKKYADEMRRFAALCGLTIDSRLKAGAYMAEKKQQDISDQFGDI